ncbi:hypothetical protein Maq22A_c11545 [Methylobacterium aquaticum]|uniref:Uncharacterized protein n=1 Tax=Methylobacterium aquaticum TaxID=270351 RepID=A0A0C6FF32_9HYPH|nr:hypothetical protein Maq22A_c11545 [Methylobacterium aquaticum]
MFSVIGIIGLQSRVSGTVRVAAVVVATLRHWIGHIAGFGRMGDIHRVEEDAAGRYGPSRPTRRPGAGRGNLGLRG